MKRLTAIAAVAVSTLISARSSAGGTEECAKAYEQVQSLRREGKLTEAKKQAVYCAAERCPQLLSQQCGTWLVELEGEIPSLLFDAVNPDGTPRAEVNVFIDDVLVVDHLDGRPLNLNPGPHTIRFETQGLIPEELKLLVHEGDRARRFKVRFKVPPTKERPVPLATWILGGVSVASLALGAYFTISGLSKKGSLEDCKPTCNPDDVDAMTRNFALGDIFLGAGLVSGGAAALSFALRPEAGVGSSSRALIPTLVGRF